MDTECPLASERLVAPILNECWTRQSCSYDKRVCLPRGEWLHLFRGVTYGSTSEGVWIDVPAPIGRPAVFYKDGSAVGATCVQNLRAAGIEVDAPPS